MNVPSHRLLALPVLLACGFACSTPASTVQPDAGGSSGAPTDARTPCTDPLECSTDGVPYPKDRWGLIDRAGNALLDGGVDPRGCSTGDGAPVTRRVAADAAPGSRLPNKPGAGFRDATTATLEGQPMGVSPALLFDPNGTRGHAIGRFIETAGNGAGLLGSTGWMKTGGPLFIRVYATPGGTSPGIKEFNQYPLPLAPGSVVADQGTEILPFPNFPTRLYVDLRSMEILAICPGGPGNPPATDPTEDYWAAWAAATPPSY